jgi:hypothetical protein
LDTPHSSRLPALEQVRFQPQKVVHFEPVNFDHSWCTLGDR